MDQPIDKVVHFVYSFNMKTKSIDIKLPKIKPVNKIHMDKVTRPKTFRSKKEYNRKKFKMEDY